MSIYLVGGAVRDKLLGLPVSEKDYVVTGKTIDDMLKAGFVQVGKTFPVFLHPDTKEEYALARREKKQGEGHRGFVCYFEPSITLEADLFRRDLTINAIAEDSKGHLIDPSNGLQDLKLKQLKHIGPAFVEDPLRCLRVARFYAKLHHLDFKIHPETMVLMSKMVASGDLKTLSPERVWQETLKALGTKRPSKYFLALSDMAALPQLWPTVQFSRREYAWMDRDDLSATQKAIIWLSRHVPDPLSFSKSWRIPQDWSQVALGFSQAEALMAETDQLDHLMRMFKKLNAYHDQEKLTTLLEILMVLYPDQNSHFQLWWQAARALKEVSFKDLDQANLKGPEISKAIEEKRKTILKNILEKHLGD